MLIFLENFNMICKSCGTLLDLNNWLPSRQKRNQAICKICIRKDNNNRYQKYKDKYLQSYKNKYIQIKQLVFDYYGGKCQLCNENNYIKLSLDHIDKNGRSQRRKILKKDSGTSFYKWILKNKPNNIRILCFNCNCQHSMQKYNLNINNKNYLENKICKYCSSNTKVKKYTCSLCNNKLKHNYQINLKEHIYKIYGGKCNACNCSNYPFLTIDHINQDGYIHRKHINNIYSWLRRNNYPSDNFQLLCYNCNYLKYFKYL